MTGEGRLLKQLTRRVLESALEGQITDRLGYEEHNVAGRGSGNNRNGTFGEMMLTDVGPVVHTHRAVGTRCDTGGHECTSCGSQHDPGGLGRIAAEWYRLRDGRAPERGRRPG